MTNKANTIQTAAGAFPCYATLGAMLRFKRHTGKEISDVRLDDLENLFTFLYCCVQSACAREGKPFDLDELTFADSITPDEMQRWAQSLTQPADQAAAEKKTAKK